MTTGRNHARKRRKAPKELWSQGPAGPAKSLITGKIYPAEPNSKKSRLERRFDALERQYEK